MNLSDFFHRNPGGAVAFSGGILPISYGRLQSMETTGALIMYTVRFNRPLSCRMHNGSSSNAVFL